MNRFRSTITNLAATLVLASLFALALVATAAAQGGPAGGASPMGGMMGPQPRGIFNPIVGSGAVYEIQRNGDDKKINLEIAVVGKESTDGKDSYWFETEANTPMGQMIMKMLMVPDGANTNVTRMIMQMPGRPPMEMPQMGRLAQQRQSLDVRAEADKLGSESVTTPAGTFTADHYRAKDGTGDFWLSDKISPYGLIKYQGRGSTMVLTKVIADAKEKITGTPVPFNPMSMGGGQGPR